jgi:hypothetical protein
MIKTETLSGAYGDFNAVSNIAPDFAWKMILAVQLIILYTSYAT